MTPITPEQWLALALITESARPHEWPAIAAVILNRVERPSYPGAVFEVIRQPMQFSAFNATRHLAPEAAYLEVRRVHQLGELGEPTSAFEAEALAVAAETLDDAGRPLRKSRRPFGPGVLNYWSPQSMVPRGGLPPWQWSGLRCFTLDGIDPWRFVFAETLDVRHHPSANNASVYDFRERLAAARKIRA